MTSIEITFIKSCCCIESSLLVYIFNTLLNFKVSININQGSSLKTSHVSKRSGVVLLPLCGKLQIRYLEVKHFVPYLPLPAKYIFHFLCKSACIWCVIVETIDDKLITRTSWQVACIRTTSQQSYIKWSISKSKSKTFPFHLMNAQFYLKSVFILLRSPTKYQQI